MQLKLKLKLKHNNEISDYAYERTLMMEQRTEIIKRLNLNRKQSLLLEQEVDGRVIRFRIRKPSTCDFEDIGAPLISPAFNQANGSSNGGGVNSIVERPVGGIAEHYPLVELPSGQSADGLQSAIDEQTKHQQQQQQQQPQPPISGMRPDETNLLRMHNALTLNEAILKRSKAAKLVITNLPGVPRVSTPEAENNCEYCERS